MFWNQYALMKRAYELAILASNATEKFERYVYRWLDTFEHGDSWA